jgi:hypothetical protein
MALLVTVATRLTIPEALVMRSCLEAHGIVASLDAFNYATMVWQHTFAIQGLTLSVAQPDAERAHLLLAASTLPSRIRSTDTVPALSTGLIRAFVSVGIWALTGLPCPYWERQTDPDDATDPEPD